MNCEFKDICIRVKKIAGLFFIIDQMIYVWNKSHTLKCSMFFHYFFAFSVEITIINIFFVTFFIFKNKSYSFDLIEEEKKIYYSFLLNFDGTFIDQLTFRVVIYLQSILFTSDTWPSFS